MALHGRTLWQDVAACACNAATWKALFRNDVGSIPASGNSPVVGWWIVWSPVIHHKDLDEILDQSSCQLPNRSIFVKGYGTTFRPDRNFHAGFILLYDGENIPQKLLLVEEDSIGGLFTEINLRNKIKWPISCSDNPKKSSLLNHTTAFIYCQIWAFTILTWLCEIKHL